MKIFNNKNLLRKAADDPFSIQEGKIKNGKMGSVYRLNWTEEMFEPTAGKKTQLGLSFNFSRLYPVIFMLVVFVGILLFKIAWLQVVKREYYYSMAEGNRVRIERIEPKRGVIYDRNNKPLVHNVANFLLYIIPSDLPKKDEDREVILRRMAGILPELKYEEVKDKLSAIKPNSLESFQPLFIEDNIDYEKAMLLYLESESMSGVVLSNRTRRDYLYSLSSLSHILGYTGKINEAELKKASKEYQPIDYIGKMGVENYWESDMKGISGQKYIEVDALGKEKKIISIRNPEDGSNLVLSLDVELQKKLEEIMKDHLDKIKLRRGSAVLMDPNNGEILALVSLPGYDNNLFAKGISSDEYKKLIEDKDKPLFNRAVSGEFPSGSVIKPVMAAAALEEGVINENTSFVSAGGIRIGQWFFPDWKAGGHGVTNVKKAIAQSVNTFFYIIGGGYQNFVGLGVDRIVKYEKLFNLGAILGIDLPGEAEGFVPTREWKEETTGERWYIGNTYNMSIGQGDTLVTPIQVANYTSFFANGGTLYRPHLVKEILNSGDENKKSLDAKRLKENIIKDYNVRIVREGMRQTVISGSARSLSALPVEVAGKTGTAQWSSKKKEHAWFTCFAPYDKPELVLTVLIEEGGGGDVVAVPVAREFLQWYYTGKKGTSTEQISTTTKQIIPASTHN